MLSTKNILEAVTGYSVIKSEILEKGDFKLLKEWLGYKPKLKLLYSVKRDGDPAAKFWELCEN